MVATVPFASLPIQHPGFVAAALAQDTAATDVGEETDLVVVALHCAEAPATAALAAYFSTGAPPTRCAPSVDVAIAVTENETPLPGSPFTTDVAGSLGVPVGRGAALAVREDPASLPSGYEPLTQEANGVPYANPVQLDAAVAGAAVLFVNVPATVIATLAEDSPATDASESADRVDAVTPDANAAARAATTLAAASAPDRTGCDPAYPDERTCIPSGAPLASPCAITEMRNFTVLPPDPRGLDADGDGIGCEPISPAGGIINNPSNLRLDASDGAIPLAAPTTSAGARRLTVVTTPTRGDAVLQIWPRHSGTDIWTWPGHSRAGNWHWPRHVGGSIRVWPGHLSGGNLSVAVSGATTVAISGSAVRGGNGLWFWTPGRQPANDRNMHGNGVWAWPHDGIHSGDWRANGTGVWIWSGAAARSGNGSVAAVGSAVRIGTGIWLLPPGRGRADGWLWPQHIDAGWLRHIGAGGWFWSGAVARSSSGALAVSGSSLRLGAGIWLLPADRGHFDTWHGHVETWDGHGGATRVAESGAEPLTIGDDLAIAPAPIALEQGSNDSQPSPTIADDLAIAPLPADAAPPVGDDSHVAPATDASVELPPDTATPPADAAAPVSENVDPGYVAPEPGYVDPSYVAPEPSIDPGYIAPDPISVEPEPAYVDPGYVAPEPEPVYVDPGYAAPEPADVGSEYVAPDPGYVDPVNVGTDFVDPGSGDFGNSDAGFVSPDPGFDPGFSDPADVAPDLGGDAGFAAPEPVIVDSGGNGFGNGNSGSGAADFGGGPDVGPSIDPGTSVPDLDVGGGEQGQLDE